MVSNMSGCAQLNSSEIATTPCGPRQPQPFEQFPEARVHFALQKIFPPITLCVGTLGNLLCIAVMLKRKNRRNSTSLFLLALAISDLVVLWSGLLRIWVKSTWNQDLREVSSVACKLEIYLLYASIQVSSWILVALTMERVLCVTCPHRVRLYVTRRNAARAIVTIWGFLYGINSHFLYGFDVSSQTEYLQYGRCRSVHKDYRQFVYFMWTWVNVSLSFLLPFILLLVGNAIIIKRLSRRFEFRTWDQNRESSSDSANVRRLGFLSVMLLVVFAISITPAALYLPLSPYIYTSNQTVREQATGMLVRGILDIFQYVNASCNFFLYCLNGRRFRRDVRDLLLPVCPWRPSSHMADRRSVGARINNRSSVSLEVDTVTSGYL